MNDDTINIIAFRPEFAGAFGQLNLAWVTKYFTVEPNDALVLNNPEQYIINQGGHIYFALVGEEVAGTFALVPQGDSVYELSKMAVAECYQGRSIGNALLRFCMQEARRLGGKELVLFSNTILQPAIHLYKKYGFKEVPLGDSIYRRSNIKMAIDFNSIT